MSNTKPHETVLEVEKSGWWHGNIMLETNQEISEEQYEELFETDYISYETVCRLMELGAESGEAVPARLLRNHIRESIAQEILSGEASGDIFGDRPTWELWFEGTLEDKDISWDDLSEASQEHVVHAILEDECRQGELCEYQCFNLTVSNLETSSDGYITGTITLDDETCALEYNIATEDLSFHKYTQPGWLTGSSYETKLPEAITDNIEAIVEEALEAITGYLNEMDVRGTYPEMYSDIKLYTPNCIDWEIMWDGDILATIDGSMVEAKLSICNRDGLEAYVDETIADIQAEREKNGICTLYPEDVLSLKNQMMNAWVDYIPERSSLDSLIADAESTDTPAAQEQHKRDNREDR